jgi:hypothetical protein
MIKLYKNRNPHIKKLSLLFVYQVILGALPAILFAIFVTYVHLLDELDEYNIWVGILFISIILLSFAGYVVAAKKYNILVSGYRGEKLLVKTAKRLNGNYTIFTNLPIRYKKNRSEIDLLVVSENGVLAIEVKNHSGVIIGSDEEDVWIHRKYYRKGKTTETEMENPYKQVKRQREILKNIFRANGIEIWLDSILFFSGNPGLRLEMGDKIAVASSEKELIELITGYKSQKPPTREECVQIIELLRDIRK